MRIGAHMRSETTEGGRPGYTESLPRTPESARAARLLVSWSLQAWDLGDLEEAAHIVVTELVSNAVVHARRHLIRVTVTRLDEHLVQVAVVDLSPELPRSRPAGTDDESGRGLALVAALTDGRWGIDPLRWGKRVWADLAAMKE
jgi:anti-sigma regulatory factor (Ser/Thr protein kinase)